MLATVAAGMTMGNIGVLTPKERFGLSLTPHGRAFVLAFWEFAAFLANSLVFLLIGSALATIDFAREGFFALALVIALALAGRAAAVYPVCLAFSRTRWAIRLNEQHSCGGGDYAERWRSRSRFRCLTTCRCATTF